MNTRIAFYVGALLLAGILTGITFVVQPMFVDGTKDEVVSKAVTEPKPPSTDPSTPPQLNQASVFTFTSSGRFTVPSVVSKLELLVIGGGGGGGYGQTGRKGTAGATGAGGGGGASGSGGGGGRAGQVVSVIQSVQPGEVINIIVGQGGGPAVAGGSTFVKTSTGDVIAAGGSAGDTLSPGYDNYVVLASANRGGEGGTGRSGFYCPGTFNGGPGVPGNGGDGVTTAGAAGIFVETINGDSAFMLPASGTSSAGSITATPSGGPRQTAVGLGGNGGVPTGVSADPAIGGQSAGANGADGNTYGAGGSGSAGGYGGAGGDPSSEGENGGPAGIPGSGIGGYVRVKLVL